MKRDEILAKSQGLYGRLLSDQQNMPQDLYNTVMENLEAQNFKDSVDLVLYIEG